MSINIKNTFFVFISFCSLYGMQNPEGKKHRMEVWFPGPDGKGMLYELWKNDHNEFYECFVKNDETKTVILKRKGDKYQQQILTVDKKQNEYLRVSYDDCHKDEFHKCYNYLSKINCRGLISQIDDFITEIEDKQKHSR